MITNRTRDFLLNKKKYYQFYDKVTLRLHEHDFLQAKKCKNKRLSISDILYISGFYSEKFEVWLSHRRYFSLLFY